MRRYWSLEDDDRLRSLWADGLSAEMIGRKMGYTRNKIVGRVWRLELPKRPTRIPSPRVYGHRQGGNNIPIQPKCKPLPKPKLLPADEVAPGPPRALDELTNATCRWPADGMYCGTLDADLIAGRPYCCIHAKLAYGRQESRPFRRRQATGVSCAATHFGGAR